VTVAMVCQMIWASQARNRSVQPTDWNKTLPTSV